VPAFAKKQGVAQRVALDHRPDDAASLEIGEERRTAGLQWDTCNAVSAVIADGCARRIHGFLAVA
jgi:hypothetical protein